MRQLTIHLLSLKVWSVKKTLLFHPKETMGVEVISTEGKQEIIVVCNIKIYDRFCSGCKQSIMNVSEAIASH